MRATEPIIAKGIETTAEELVIVLEDCRVRIRWEECSPALAAATEQQRREAELSSGGYGVHWALIDEDLSVSGLLRKA
jgi:hypothetical protein